MRGAIPTSAQISRISSAAPAVGAPLVDRDPPADDVLLELVERALHLGAALRVDRLVARRSGVLREHGLLDGLRRVLALELVLDLRRAVELGAVRGLDLVEQALVDLRLLDHDLLLAGLRGQLALRGAELLDLVVRDLERVEHLGLGDLVGTGLDHQDRVVGAGDDQVELGLGDVGLGRVDDELALELADAHRADLRRERDVGQRQRGRGAVHREDVVGD